MPHIKLHASRVPFIAAILTAAIHYSIYSDADNTLVLSERLAFLGCARLGNEILRNHGVDHAYEPRQMQTEFVGQNFRKLMHSLQTKHNFTMTESEMDTYVDRELRELIESLEKDCEPCINANSTLAQLQKDGKYGMAVVSSSALPRVLASVKRAGQAPFFDERKIFSAATSLPVPTSKPDPAVYLFACEKLGVKPEECLAVEDSRSGATAAMRAGIHLLGYTGACDDEEEAHETAEMLRKDCRAIEIMSDWKELPSLLEKIEKM